MNIKFIAVWILPALLFLSACDPRNLSITGLSAGFRGGNVGVCSLAGDKLVLDIYGGGSTNVVTVSPWVSGGDLLARIEGSDVRAAGVFSPEGPFTELAFAKDGREFLRIDRSARAGYEILPGVKISGGGIIKKMDAGTRSWAEVLIVSGGSTNTARPGEPVMLAAGGGKWAFILAGASVPGAPREGIRGEDPGFIADFVLVKEE